MTVPAEPQAFDGLTSWLRSASLPEVEQLSPSNSDSVEALRYEHSVRAGHQFRLMDIFEGGSPVSSETGSVHKELPAPTSAMPVFRMSMDEDPEPLASPEGTLHAAVNQVIAHAADRFMSTVDDVDVAFEILIERARQQAAQGTPPMSPASVQLDAAAFHAAAVALHSQASADAELPFAGDESLSQRFCAECQLSDVELTICNSCDRGYHLHCLADPPLSAHQWVCPRCVVGPAPACAACGMSDHNTAVIQCGQCGRGYHPLCTTPQLLYVPQTAWFCRDCSATRPKSRAKSMSPPLQRHAQVEQMTAAVHDGEDYVEVESGDEVDESIVFPTRETQTYKVAMAMVDLGAAEYHRPVEVTRRCGQLFPSLPPEAVNKVLARGLNRYFRKRGRGRGVISGGYVRNPGAEYRLRRQFQNLE